MKQKTMFDCVPIVAAMITGLVPDSFIRFQGTDPEKGYTDLQLYKYLLYKGYIVGGGYNLSQADTIPDGIINFNYDIKGKPAYVTVKSERVPGKDHAIYWDGKQIRDPNPEVPDGRSISDYQLIDWFPITKLEDVA